MAEQIVLLAVDDVYNRPLARVIGRDYGLYDLVAVSGRILVTKAPARRVFSGQGRPRRYAPVSFEVWEVVDVEFHRDASSQQVVKAHRRIGFDKNV